MLGSAATARSRLVTGGLYRSTAQTVLYESSGLWLENAVKGNQEHLRYFSIFLSLLPVGFGRSMRTRWSRIASRIRSGCSLHIGLGIVSWMSSQVYSSGSSSRGSARLTDSSDLWARHLWKDLREKTFRVGGGNLGQAATSGAKPILEAQGNHAASFNMRLEHSTIGCFPAWSSAMAPLRRSRLLFIILQCIKRHNSCSRAAVLIT